MKTVSTSLTIALCFALSLATGCMTDDDTAPTADEMTETTSVDQAVNTWRPVCWDVTAFYSIWWEHIDNFHRGTTVYEYYKILIGNIHYSHIITHGGRVGWVRTAALC